MPVSHVYSQHGLTVHMHQMEPIHAGTDYMDAHVKLIPGVQAAIHKSETESHSQCHSQLSSLSHAWK